MGKRLDGMLNLLAGLGRSRDKTSATTTAGTVLLTDQELRDIWTGNGYGKRIVETMANDMTRKWITHTEDSDGRILQEMDRLDFSTIVNRALCWARLFGGALIVGGYEDGQTLDQPRASTVSTISWFRVYGRDQVQVRHSSLETDPTKANFGEYSLFSVEPRNGVPFDVHTSRCLIFKGLPYPTKAAPGNDLDYWGMSELQPIWDQIKNLGTAEQSVANILMEIVIGKYKIKGLAEKIAMKKEEEVVTRMELISMYKSVINGVLLDAEMEDYTRDTVSLAGIPDILDRYMTFIAGVSDYPVTRLFGRSPAGQNATGESDARNYYDAVSSRQQTQLRKPLQLVTDIMAQYLKVPNAPQVEFVNLWAPTQAEELAMRKTQAEIDAIYLNPMAQVLVPEEVRKSRFENGYGYETTLDEDMEDRLPNENTPPPIPEEEILPEEGPTE